MVQGLGFRDSNNGASGQKHNGRVWYFSSWTLRASVDAGNVAPLGGGEPEKRKFRGLQGLRVMRGFFHSSMWEPFKVSGWGRTSRNFEP